MEREWEATHSSREDWYTPPTPIPPEERGGLRERAQQILALPGGALDMFDTAKCFLDADDERARLEARVRKLEAAGNHLRDYAYCDPEVWTDEGAGYNEAIAAWDAVSPAEAKS